jgi:hypothetical protein
MTLPLAMVLSDLEQRRQFDAVRLDGERISARRRPALRRRRRTSLPE